MSTDLFDRYASLDPANSPQAAPDWASTAPVLLAAIDERTTPMQTPDTLDIPTEPKTRRSGMLIAAAVFAIVVIAGAVLAIVSTQGEPQPAAPESEIIEVTFDGNECTVTGPTEVPSGDRAFVLTDVSDLGAVLFARMLVDGHTFQDALDAEEEAGGPGVYWLRPSWFASAPVDMDPPEIDLADNQQLLASRLYPGNHLVGLYTTTGSELIWLCGPLDVVEP